MLELKTLGGYLPWFRFKQDKSVRLLSLHPTAAGRVYAAYGGFTAASPFSGCEPSRPGSARLRVALSGMAIISFAPRGT